MPSSTRHRRAFAALSAALIALPLFVAAGSPADAQTAVADESELRTAAAAGGVVELAADIELTCGDGALTVTEDLTLRSATDTMVTLSIDSGCDRLIEATGAALTIENLHLTGGRAPQGPNGDFEDGDGHGTAGGDGGAILSDNDVVLTNARFSDNRAGDGGHGDNGADGTDPGDPGADGGNGGPGGSGGAIFTTGNVTATATSFTNNHAGRGGDAGSGGSGIAGADGVATQDGGNGGNAGTAGHGGDGGAIAAGGTVELASSTLDGNSAGAGGTGGNGGDGANGGDGDNVADANGNGGNGGDATAGGEAGSGGAVRAGTVASTTSTIHGNTVASAGSGGEPGSGGLIGNGDSDSGLPGSGGTGGGTGAPGSGGAISTATALTLTSSTVTANTAIDGDAARSLDAGGDLTLDHTIASGTGPGDDCQSVGTVTADQSVAGDATCTGADVIAEGDLGLGVLSPNGGQTQTRLPDENSDLLDAGATTCPASTDQRGVLRPQGSGCDIGAVERRGTFQATVLGVAADTSVAVGGTTQVTFTVTVSDDSTGRLAASELVPTITGCTSTPIRSGAAEPFVAEDVILWTCDVTSDAVTTAALSFDATVASGEGTVLPLSAAAEVSFAQVTTTTAADTTTTQVTDPPVIDDSGSGGNGALPTTGLSIFLTVVAAATLLFGGGGLTRYAKTRVARSRWGLERGVPVPIGTHRSRPADRQVD